MRQTKIFLLLFLLSKLSFGQRSTSEIGFQEYYNLLAQKKVDTIIVYRWGCVGCDRKYDTNFKSTAKGEIIYVLTTHNGISEIATFDHYSISHDTVDASSVFTTIEKNRKMLLSKKLIVSSKTDVEISKRKPPFMFEIFAIDFSAFSFSSEIFIDENYRMKEANMKNKRWYTATQKIIEQLLKCLPILPIE